MFYCSAIFDMLETNVPRDNEQRLLIQSALFGREAINVISCEGLERLERPETFKQWRVRNQRAGFKQLPMNQDIMKRVLGRRFGTTTRTSSSTRTTDDE
ncbi:hypothetical protein EJB05_18733, partial [Eragrostis curvula]